MSIDAEIRRPDVPPEHHPKPTPEPPRSAPSRAVLVALLIAVPVLGPIPFLGSDQPMPDEAVVAETVPLASPARVVRVDQPAPAARPVGLGVPAIGLAETEMVDLGLDPDGRLQAPEDFSRVGWYTAGPAPGDPGPAVIVGHVDSWRGPAVFFRVRELRPGDEITVPRADGTTAAFVVDAVEQYSKDAFPAETVYRPTADPQLRLITCGGSFDPVTRSYRDNVVVFASAR